MKKCFATLTFVLCMASAVQAQSTMPETRSVFQPFRYDEDWSFLSDNSRQTDWLDRLKYIPLGGENWYVTLGGEIRERFELLDQPGFGTGPEDKNGYFLERYLLSSDFHLGSRVRVFTELQSGLENGRNGGPRPTDIDRLDLHQAFVDWKIFSFVVSSDPAYVRDNDVDTFYDRSVLERESAEPGRQLCFFMDFLSFLSEKYEKDPFADNDPIRKRRLVDRKILDSGGRAFGDISSNGS